MIWRIIELSRGFFCEVGGCILEVKIVEGDPGGAPTDPAWCPVFLVQFSNADLFGGTVDFYPEVYERYRMLRKDWWDSLKKDGALQAADRHMEVRPHFVPFLSKPYRSGISYPRLERSGSALKIVRLREIERSPYLRRLFSKYHLEYGIRTSNGKLFDLDEALLLGVRSTVETLGEVDLFMDVGTGTGSASALAMRKANVNRVIANDVSEEVRPHLESYLGSLANGTQTHFEVAIEDCTMMEYPLGIDVLAISTIFGSQPTLLWKKGAEIRKSLGSKGVLLSATSMTDMTFYHHLIHGTEPRLSTWPWYTKVRSLDTLFAHLKALRVRNQVLTLASQSGRIIENVSDKMKKEGAEDFNVGPPSIFLSSLG